MIALAGDSDGERVTDGLLTTSGEPRASQKNYPRTQRRSESDAFRNQTTDLPLRAAVQNSRAARSEEVANRGNRQRNKMFNFVMKKTQNMLFW